MVKYLQQLNYEKKIAVITPANIWLSPFIKSYTKLFDSWGISYDIISWDRSGSDEKDTISYKGKVGQSKFSKLLAYYNFAQFVKKVVRNNRYTDLVVFTSQLGIFISSFLRKYYKRRYIFDFRDLSIEQYNFLSRPFRTLLDNSFANVISSPGFKKCLPEGHQYLVCHNFDIVDVVRGIEKVGVNLPESPIKILTIGGIRDYDSNAPLMDAIGNDLDFELSFVGRGPSAQELELHKVQKGFKNVFFEGFYKKEDERKYIEESTFMNIYYPDLLSHATAMSNRFYNSIIYRKPMIVTKGQIQGDYCERYGLGIVVDDITDLPAQIHQWLSNNDPEKYEKRCIELLQLFRVDYYDFLKIVKSFCRK